MTHLLLDIDLLPAVNFLYYFPFFYLVNSSDFQFSPPDGGEETRVLVGYSLSRAVVLVTLIKGILGANFHYLLDANGTESSAVPHLLGAHAGETLICNYANYILLFAPSSNPSSKKKSIRMKGTHMEAYIRTDDARCGGFPQSRLFSVTSL